MLPTRYDFRYPPHLKIKILFLREFLQESHLLSFQSLKNQDGGNIANNFRQTQPVNDR